MWQLNQRQAERERAAGKLGIGTREQLLARLRELQKQKRVKSSQAEAEEKGGFFSAAVSPSAAAAMGRHASSMPAGAPPAEEWRERLQQAKAKYVSSLDQLVPEWQASAQQRRMEQLVNYEKAIGQCGTSQAQMCGQCTVLAIHTVHRVLFCSQTLCYCVVRLLLLRTRRSARSRRC